MPENGGSEGQKRTKMPILCSGMVAASPAAPTGAQHYLPRALRGASGSSAPGNRLPQPTTQPAAKTYLPGILPCIPRPTHRHATCRRACCREQHRAYRRGATAKNYRRVLPPKATASALPPRNYRKKLPPCAAPGQPTRRGILPCDGSRAQRAGDSDVGANDKGAGDDPGDGVDAH